MLIRARGGSVSNVVQDRSHCPGWNSRPTVADSRIVTRYVIANLTWQATEMVSVGVDVPQCPGRIGTDLRPQTFNIATAVGITWWATDGDF